MHRDFMNYEKAVLSMFKSSVESLIKNFIPVDSHEKELMIKFIDYEIFVLRNSMYKKEIFDEDKEYNRNLMNFIKKLEEHKNGIISGKIEKVRNNEKL